MMTFRWQALRIGSFVYASQLSNWLLKKLSQAAMLVKFLQSA